MSRYTSKHTGPKIDEAVDRANGYGLGGIGKRVTDMNNAQGGADIASLLAMLNSNS